jgi:predicted amidohydrolase
VLADIDVGRARARRRPDGTDLLALRRPELYGPVAQDVPPLPATGAPEVRVAAVQAGCGDLEALAGAVTELAGRGVELIVLPELASEPDGVVTDPAAAALAGRALVERLVAALSGTESHVVVSVVEADHADGAAGPGTGELAYAHVGLVLDRDGIKVHQPALHRPARHAGWQAVLGDRVKVLATSFGRLSVLVGDDALVPEAGRLAVLGGAEVVAVPFSVAEPTDLALALPERCAENRVCLVAASRPDVDGASGAFDPPENPVWSRADRPAPFDGTINDPDRHLAGVEAGSLVVTLHPARAAEKLITTDTDLVFGRRPELRASLVAPA